VQIIRRTDDGDGTLSLASGAMSYASPTSPSPAVRSASLAVVAGAAWVLAVTLVATQADTDPVGAAYDDANRVVTLAVALLAASAVVAWRDHRGRARLAAVAGTALMLLGSALEFVLLPLLGGRPDAMAAREGGETSALSSVGFGVFAVGSLLLLAAGVALAVTLRGRTTLDRVLVALTGPAVVAGTVLWAVSPAPAALAACIAAAGWWRTVAD
jgi:hypothetical protein